MADILFLAQRIPYPPVKGDKIRSFHALRHLARRHRVYCGAFVDDPADWAQAGELRRLCAELFLVPLDRRTAMLRGLSGLLTAQPLGLPYTWDRRLADWVGTVVAERRPALAYVFSSAMAQYVAAPPHPLRVVMDFCDVDSQKWAAYAEKRPWPLSWLYRREARLLLAHDRAVAARAEAALFVSEAEAALFRRLAPEAAARVAAVPNGVDTAYFTPDLRPASPFTAEGPHVVFTGAMDYAPNVEAVCWFADNVLPRLRRHHAVTFAIVGAHPAPAVARLARRDGVVVTGRVADVRPYLTHADAVVAPLAIARGVQNKVLEAMAMARPVVATPQALEGIGATPGRHLLVAERTAEAFAEATMMALSPASAPMGAAARALACAEFSWTGALRILDRVLEGVMTDAVTV